MWITYKNYIYLWTYVIFTNEYICNNQMWIYMYYSQMNKTVNKTEDYKIYKIKDKKKYLIRIYIYSHTTNLYRLIK